MAVFDTTMYASRPCTETPKTTAFAAEGANALRFVTALVQLTETVPFKASVGHATIEPDEPVVAKKANVYGLGRKGGKRGRR